MKDADPWAAPAGTPAARADPPAASHDPPPAPDDPPPAPDDPPSAPDAPPAATHDPPAARDAPPAATHDPPSAPDAPPSVTHDSPAARADPPATPGSRPARSARTRSLHPADSPRFDAVADRLASLQHGVVTRRQLLEAGISGGVIDRRLQNGRLKPLFQGIYRVGPLLLPIAHEMAASLACGPGAVVSHHTAAALWGMIEHRSGREVHVSVPARHPRRTGIVTHRSARLRADETTVHQRVPTTTPARTIYDLAASEHARVLERAVSEAVISRLMTLDEVAAMVRRYAGRAGGRALREVLGEHGPRFTRSDAEVRFLALVERAGLPVPLTNVTVAGYEVDFHWPADRLVFEVDGFAYHSSRQAFERDRTRDGDLAAAGLRVVRVTWRQLVDEPLAVAARLGACLAQAAPRRARRPRRR